MLPLTQSCASIGGKMRVNRQAAARHNLPAVSYLKAPLVQHGQPAKSDPLDEQTLLVETINQLQTLPEWAHIAIVITWDDSDGWYDHVVPPIVNQSNDSSLDHLCGQPPALTAPFVTSALPFPATAYNDRCGYGQRLPMLVISPFAKHSYVDRTITDTTSILRFIEDNWETGRIDSLDHPSGTPEGQASFDSIARSPACSISTARPICCRCYSIARRARSGKDRHRFPRGRRLTGNPRPRRAQAALPESARSGVPIAHQIRAYRQARPRASELPRYGRCILHATDGHRPHRPAAGAAAGAAPGNQRGRG
jgi:hypothetical protein